jgi:V8-like Glu-specific endopeptidase
MMADDLLSKATQEQIEEYPLNCLGYIEGYAEGGVRYMGTGILISSNVVLTCAHNVYGKDKKSDFKEVRFYLRQHGPIREYFEVEEHYYPDEFREKPGSAKDDYALLKLK